MSDDSEDEFDSNQPKSVFDVETVIWSPEKRNKNSSPQTNMKLSDITNKTRVKVTSFNDEATVIANVNSQGDKHSGGHENVSSILARVFAKNNDETDQSIQKRIIPISISGLVVGLMLFYFLNQKTKKIEAVEIQTKTTAEKSIPKSQEPMPKIEAHRANDLAHSQKSSANSKQYSTTQDFLAGFAEAVSESQSLASRR